MAQLRTSIFGLSLRRIPQVAAALRVLHPADTFSSNFNIWAEYEEPTASSSGTSCPPPRTHRSAPNLNISAEPAENSASASSVTLGRSPLPLLTRPLHLRRFAMVVGSRRAS